MRRAVFRSGGFGNAKRVEARHTADTFGAARCIALSRTVDAARTNFV
jgi:hypothetical protein